MDKPGREPTEAAHHHDRLMRSAPTSPNAILAVVMVGAFLGQFDLFVVNVAAPSIQRSLHTSDMALELIVAGYAFSFAASLITGGRLGDLFGYRRVYTWGLLAFGTTTLLCGLAPTATTLVASRLLQGVAAGIMIPQVLASVADDMPPDRRLSAMGWYGAAGGIGSIAGQFAGGALVAWDTLGLGWRLIFFVTVPLALVTAVAARFVLPQGSPRGIRGLDLPGVAGLAVGVGLLMLAVLSSAESVAPVTTLLLAACGLAVLGLALLHEHRLRQRGGQPAVDLRLLRIASLWRGLVGVTAFMLYFASFLYLLTNVLQRGLGLSAWHAGLVFVPSGVTFAASSLLFRHWSAAHQIRSITIGCCITMAGLGLAAWGTLAGSAPVAFLITAVVLTGVGNGLTLPVLIGYALAEVPRSDAGIGSALVSTVQQFASALGVVVFGTAFHGLSRAGRPDDMVRAMGGCVLAQAGLLIAVLAVTRHRVRGTS